MLVEQLQRRIHARLLAPARFLSFSLPISISCSFSFYISFLFVSLPHDRVRTQGHRIATPKTTSTQHTAGEHRATAGTSAQDRHPYTGPHQMLRMLVKMCATNTQPCAYRENAPHHNESIPVPFPFPYLTISYVSLPF